MISFGSLEFRATGNGYLMQLLPPGRNPVTPTSPARRKRALGPMFATGTGGAASRGTPQLPHVGRGWHVAAQHHGQWGHRFVITCFGVIYAGIVTCCGTSASQGGSTPASPFPFRMRNAAARAS